jgi:hypothetical protein
MQSYCPVLSALRCGVGSPARPPHAVVVRPERFELPT